MSCHEEALSATVTAPAGDGDTAQLSSDAYFAEIEIIFDGIGDPDYKLQILNSRGTVTWESPITITGDTIITLERKVAARRKKLRIKASTLAGGFRLFATTGQ